MNSLASVTFAHEKSSSRLWALFTLIPVKGIILIPHLIAMYGLMIATEFMAFLGIFAVLFTGRYPAGWQRFVIGVIRWAWRINSYIYCMTDKYPPFTLKSGGYPADLDFPHQEKNSRMLALATIIPIKFIALIPHMLVLCIYGIIAGIALLVGFLVVLFKGEYSKSIENIVVGYQQYSTNVMGYALCFTDKYPSISWK